MISEDDDELMLHRETAESVAELIRPDLPKTLVNLPRRSVEDCLMEDLRQLDTDELYGEIMTSGLVDREPVEDDSSHGETENA